MPISIPVIDMIEIGAGGGSIASVDALDQIRIGPHSAGSEPGPAAYSLGGTRRHGHRRQPRNSDGCTPTRSEPPTSTSPPSSPRDALDRVGRRAARLDADTSAIGVAEVVDENMANAARGPRGRERQGPGRLHDDRLRRRRTAARRTPHGQARPRRADRAARRRRRFGHRLPRRTLLLRGGPQLLHLARPTSTSPASNTVLAELTDEAMSFVRQGTDAELSWSSARCRCATRARAGRSRCMLDEQSTFDELRRRAAGRRSSPRPTRSSSDGRSTTSPSRPVSWSVRVSSVDAASRRSSCRSSRESGARSLDADRATPTTPRRRSHGRRPALFDRASLAAGVARSTGRRSSPSSRRRRSSARTIDARCNPTAPC